MLNGSEAYDCEIKCKYAIGKEVENEESGGVQSRRMFGEKYHYDSQCIRSNTWSLFISCKRIKKKLTAQG